MERAVGSWRFLGFFLTAAIVSSGIQLAFISSTGIGLSGALYGIFGFVWLRRKSIEGASRVLTTPTILLFLVGLVVCVVLTAADIVSFGNTAHGAGLLFGVLVALAAGHGRASSLARAGAAALVVAAVIPLFWCPWSPWWVASRASEAKRRGDIAGAIRGYERSLEM